MINIKALKPWLIMASLILLYMNYNLYVNLTSGGNPPDTAYTAVTLSLLPAAVLILALYLLRGENRIFKVGVGVMALSYAWEFIADPWSVSLRMDLGLDLSTIMIYNVIGAVLLVIAVYAFKQV